MKITREEALEILELQDDSSEVEIKKQYRTLAMKWHPDKNPGNEEATKEMFQKVHAAYQRLTKPDDSDSDSEQIFTRDDFEAAMECFIFMMQQMKRQEGRGGDAFLFHGGGGVFMSSGFGPTFASGGGGGAQRFAPHGGGRGGRAPHVFFEEVSDDDDDDEDDYSESEDDEEDDGGEYGYYRAQERRESLRQQAQERERQRRAEDLRAKQQERQKLSEEERRRNEERLEAEARARAEAAEVEMLRKLISQLPRPTMAERSETSVTLCMSRLAKASGGSQLPKGCLWEMEMRPQSEQAWRSVHSSSSTEPVTAKGLAPGTKYVFRARGGRKLPDGSMEWGKYSEESFYATMGRPSAPAGQAAGQAADAGGQPGQSKKGRRRDAAASKKPQPQKTNSDEVDMDEAKRRLKAEKEKEAAVKAAMDRAAAEYRRETELLAAQKAETEAMLAEKVRRSRMKARKKEEAAAEPGPKDNKPPTANGQAAHSQPPPQHYRAQPPPPPRAPANNDYSDAFGNVRRINPTPAAAAAPRSSSVGMGWEAAYEDEMSLEEAIQLSMALEESERYAKEEAANRSKLQFTEQSFPSLNGKDDSGEWETWEDTDPPVVPTAKPHPPPPPPQRATGGPPAAQPAYRESRRPAPQPQPSDSAHSLYASGNRRMTMEKPAAYVPAPPPVKLRAEPPGMNGSGVYTEDDIIRQSRSPSATKANGFGPTLGAHHATAYQAPPPRTGGSLPPRSTALSSQAPARQPYNPLSASSNRLQNGAAAAYAPPASSQLPRGNAATPMATLFPHLFPNAAA